MLQFLSTAHFTGVEWILKYLHRNNHEIVQRSMQDRKLKLHSCEQENFETPIDAIDEFEMVDYCCVETTCVYMHPEGHVLQYST
jgi:hypothetical protein